MRRVIVVALVGLAVAASGSAVTGVLASGRGTAALPEAKVRPGDPARGKSVFVQAGCGACHVFAAAGAKGTLGPSLDRTLKGKSVAFVRKSIVDPNAVIARGYKPNVMPPYGRTLSKRQIDDLVSFLIRKRR